jgi:exodeoxyribonuclease VII large subunit
MVTDQHGHAWPAPGDDARPSGRPATQVWGVQALLLAVADTLAVRIGAVAVEGEIARFTRAASGHCYFALKDSATGAALRCAMFRRAASLLGFAPRDGMRVVARGRVTVYEARGELQLVVESMTTAGGDGALYERFLRLKAALESQGLFEPARKRALPPWVGRVGVVTSLAAAALHDVVTSLARRAPHVEVVVYPATVQGPDAPATLVRALRTAGDRREVDVLLLVRGGGSLEDLWAFNDEHVVRAVVASPIPVVVGVGHESDVTLADLAADLRAATPTAAAELAVPLRQALLDALASQAQRATRAMARRLEQQTVRVDRAALRAGRPARAIEVHRRRLDQAQARLPAALHQTLRARELRLQHLRSRLELAASHRMGAARQVLAAQASRLDALDPTRVLQRGYAWIVDPRGHPVMSVHRLAEGDAIQAVLVDGRVGARVESIAASPAVAGDGDMPDAAAPGTIDAAGA